MTSQRKTLLSFGALLTVSARTAKRPELDQGGKLLLPEFVLDRVLKQRMDQGVMLFLVENPKTAQQIAAGVESFSADSASVVVPHWMMECLGVAENEKVNVTLAQFPSATNVIFQPFTDEFNKLPNPRAILEHSLRQLPCLTEGSVIPIDFNKKVYKLKILKTEPAKLVSIIHADVITDFARPLSDFDHHWGEEEDAHETGKQKGKQSVFVGKAHTVRD